MLLVEVQNSSQIKYLWLWMCYFCLYHMQEPCMRQNIIKYIVHVLPSIPSTLLTILKRGFGTILLNEEFSASKSFSKAPE